MPKRIGLRDDDVMGRLADLERRAAETDEVIAERLDPKGAKPKVKKPAEGE